MVKYLKEKREHQHLMAQGTEESCVWAEESCADGAQRTKLMQWPGWSAFLSRLFDTSYPHLPNIQKGSTLPAWDLDRDGYTRAQGNKTSPYGMPIMCQTLFHLTTQIPMNRVPNAEAPKARMVYGRCSQIASGSNNNLKCWGVGQDLPVSLSSNYAWAACQSHKLCQLVVP